MSVVIRLARGGAKKRPYYRIVVADKRMKRDGRFIERIGSYNPMLAKDGEHPRVVFDEERARYWLSCGALPSRRVQGFFAQAQLMDAPPIPEQTLRHIPKAKRRGEDDAAAGAPSAQNEAGKK